MGKEVKYGVISDLHGDPNIVPLAIDVLKSQGAEKLLVNGDICDRQENLEDSQRYTAFVLDSIGKSGLESFVQPGSHETLLGYGCVIEYFSDKYDNILDCQRISQVSNNGHQLVFLPGSDSLCGGEYQIGNGRIPSGKYFIDIHNKFLPLSTPKEKLRRLSNLRKLKGMIQYANINDLKELVTEPEKTIVVSHVPRKFNKLENAVDVAEFGMPYKDFQKLRVKLENGQNDTIYFCDLSREQLVDYLKYLKVKEIMERDYISSGHIIPIEHARNMLSKDSLLPVEIKQENRGNDDLKNLYEELGITKSVSGHFHESGHRANDSYGNKVQEGVYTDNLFWNSGCLSFGQTGILTVKGPQVSYRNINLSDYLK